MATDVYKMAKEDVYAEVMAEFELNYAADLCGSPIEIAKAYKLRSSFIQTAKDIINALFQVRKDEAARDFIVWAMCISGCRYAKKWIDNREAINGAAIEEALETIENGKMPKAPF